MARRQQRDGHQDHRLAIIGAGVVGLATGTGLQARGRDVLFCDVDQERVRLLQARGLRAIHTAHLAEQAVDAYILCVPTPTVEGSVDLSCVREGAEAVGSALRRADGWRLIVVRSTVPPGTTEQVVIPALRFSSGRAPGSDFGVCTNPEFLRAATAEEDFLSPRVIVIGSLDERSEAAIRGIYASWSDVLVVSTSLRTAEATKYVANLFNAAKISFFNEMDRILVGVGADPDIAFWAAAHGAEGLWNPTYGTRGGRPYGGACLPKDTTGFLGFLEDLGLDGFSRMLRATIEVNDALLGDLSDVPQTSSEPRQGVRARDRAVS